MKIYQIAVIGCGMISKSHFAAIAQLPNARLAAVVESSTAAQTLSDSGSFACIVHYDELAEQQALHTMITNLLNGQDIAFGTGLRRDMQEPRFDLPYLQFKN